MTADSPKLQVGQQLYFVPFDLRYEPVFVEVVKVGRKWAEIQGGRRRIDAKTLLTDTTFGQDRCYLSKDDYNAATGADRAWRALVSQLSQYRPQHIILEQIIAAQKALGMVDE